MKLRLYTNAYIYIEYVLGKVLNIEVYIVAISFGGKQTVYETKGLSCENWTPKCMLRPVQIYQNIWTTTEIQYKLPSFHTCSKQNSESHDGFLTLS